MPKPRKELKGYLPGYLLRQETANVQAAMLRKALKNQDIRKAFKKAEKQLTEKQRRRIRALTKAAE